MAVWLGRRLKVLTPREPLWRSHRLRLHALLGAQLVLGLAVLAHRSAVGLRTAHAALGSLLLVQAVVLAWEIARRAPRRSPSAASRMRDYLELTKARLSGLVLLTTAVGFWLGMKEPAQVGRLLPLCAGTALVVGGANALNQWLEREWDALMERTKRRPLPAGQLSPETACRFGMGMSLAGIVVLAVAVNLLSATLAAIAWALYLLVYTPLKRRTPLCTLVGAIPGALPPMIGWAGARHALGVEAWVLFAILFIWQLPHFLALAVLYREDYARAGFPMLPLVEPDGLMTARQTALYGLALLPVSLFPTMIGVAGPAYFYGAIVLSLVFFVMAARTAWRRSRQSARQLFLASVLYLPVLLSLLALDRSPR
ncbi:MAG: protoheme IX farnesyltransferase [Candidatus Omnitrophica bacterium]|nr:protoheme IX farnesyltransferase [Candidatus Omnitrophota bacterium]